MAGGGRRREGGGEGTPWPPLLHSCGAGWSAGESDPSTQLPAPVSAWGGDSVHNHNPSLVYIYKRTTQVYLKVTIIYGDNILRNWRYSAFCAY